MSEKLLVPDIGEFENVEVIEPAILNYSPKALTKYKVLRSAYNSHYFAIKHLPTLLKMIFGKLMTILTQLDSYAARTGFQHPFWDG